MVISQGCAWPDARRNWLIYRCFRVAKTSKKAELDYAACTNCFIQMQFRVARLSQTAKESLKRPLCYELFSRIYCCIYWFFFFPVSFLLNFRFSHLLFFLFTKLFGNLFFPTRSIKFFSLQFFYLYKINLISNSKMIFDEIWIDEFVENCGWVNRLWSMVHQSVWAPFSFDLSVT